MRALDELRNISLEIENEEKLDKQFSKEQLIEDAISDWYGILLGDLKHAVQKKSFKYDLKQKLFSSEKINYRYEIGRSLHLETSDRSTKQFLGTGKVNTSFLKVLNAGSEDYGYTLEIWTTDANYINKILSGLEKKFKQEGITVIYSLDYSRENRKVGSYDYVGTYINKKLQKEIYVNAYITVCVPCNINGGI